VRVDKKAIYLTAVGRDKIREELRYLKQEKRQELSEYMGAAIADGDLSESAAYDEARMLQSSNETRIADLEEILNRAQLVEVDVGPDAAAQLGASLELEDEAGERVKFHLVGTHEADIFENRISDESPLGQQLIGKRTGDTVGLEMGVQSVSFTVVEVTYE
jgi:transcription elongation factor GreA